MNYHKIDTCNMNNGDGLRVVVWLAGCDHHCKDCFNPETWDEFSGDKMGTRHLQIIEEALENDWCSGITLTGGDPLHENNREAVSILCDHIKNLFPSKTIWIYTGYTYDEIISLNDARLSVILNNIDILVDGRFESDKKDPNLHWVGSSNQRLIDVKKTLEYGEVVLYGRQ